VAASSIRVLPWRQTLSLASTIFLVVVPAYLMLGMGAALAGVGGILVGSYATLSRGLAAAIFVAVIPALALIIMLSFPSKLVVALLGIGLIILAMFETARRGTRAFVMALTAFLIAVVGVEGGGRWEIVPLFAIGAAAGIAVIFGLNAAQALPKAKASPGSGVALGLFLGVGLALALGLMARLDVSRGYWIPLLFTSRALVPIEAQRGQALQFGLGTSLGVIAALAVKIAGVAPFGNLVLALGAAVLAIRTLPHPLPISAGCVSAAIVLATVANIDDALFRIEAAAIVVALVVVLSFGIEQFWRFIERE
jgi:hypothetical protein